MLMVRLQRVGRKHEPVFRLVLTDSKDGPKSGKFLEIMGNFDARRGEKAEFKTERIKHWISKGAKLSDTVHNLMVERGVIEGKKINALPKKTASVKEVAKEEPKAEAPKEEVKEEAPAETAPEPTAEVVEEKVV
jgi:small subunit ribosomal protein S16